MIVTWSEELEHVEHLTDDSSAYDYLFTVAQYNIFDTENDAYKNFRKDNSEKFKKLISGASDVQLYVLKQIAIELNIPEATQMLEEEKPGDLSKSMENLSLEQKYELVWSILHRGTLRPLNTFLSSDTPIKSSLDKFTDEELYFFKHALERYLKDKDSAELIGQEMKRRERFGDELKEKRSDIRKEQEGQVSQLKEHLLDDVKMPYESLYLINGEWSEEQKQEFREAIKQLSDAQLYILKQVALERKCKIAVELIEWERPWDLWKALENLSLDEKYKIARSTRMPEAFCPEWFDEVYKGLIEINKIWDEWLRISKLYERLSKCSDEELKAFASMIEDYMMDKDTAELLTKEYDRRQDLAQSLKKRRQQNKFEQKENTDWLEDKTLDETILDMDKMIALTGVSSVDKKHLVDQINMRDFKEKDFIVKCLLWWFEGWEKENIRRIQFLLIWDKDGYKEWWKWHIMWPLSKYWTDWVMWEESWDALIAYITDPDNQYLNLSNVVVEWISEDLKDQINTKHFKDKEYVIKCLSWWFEGWVKENVRRLQFLLIWDKDWYRKWEEWHKTWLLSKEWTDWLMWKETLQALAQYIDDQKNQCLVLDDIVLPRISSLNLSLVVEEINKSECKDKEYIIKCLSWWFEGWIKENVRRLQFLLIWDKDGYKEWEVWHKTWPLSKCWTDWLMWKETWKALIYYVTDTKDNGYDTFYLGRELDEYERRLEELSRMMPYTEAWDYEKSWRTEENKEGFRRSIMNLSDAQLYILKLYLKDELKSSEAVKIVEEERPGDLWKALENLTLRQKYELARSTAMPEWMSPEWFDGVYKTLLKIERVPDENSRAALKKELVYDNNDVTEEMGVYSDMIEYYMNDKDTAELLRKNAK